MNNTFADPDDEPEPASSAERLYYALYARRKPLVLAAYGLMAAAAYLLAFLIRFDFGGWAQWGQAFLVTVPAVILGRAVLARLFHLSVGRWRFISTVDLLRLLAATTAGSILFFAAAELLRGTLLIPRSVLLLEWFLTVEVTALVWVVYRTMFERVRRARWDGVEDNTTRRVLMIGAGEAGNMLAREIQRYPTGYQLTGFVDDDPLKWGQYIRGVEVIGASWDLAAIAEAQRAEALILATPSAEPAEMRRLVELCESTGLSFKVLPGIQQVLAGDVGVSQLRDVRIEDLLGRDPISLELPELARDVDGRCVLITGAAGSIGSELARQVALHAPRRLVLFDQAETDLFFVELDLRREHPDLDLVAVIGDVVDEVSVRKVFDDHAPDRVFHAAAYKHVPLMETNPEQAVRNNVLGTRIVADEAGLRGCEKFVLVSTDKAVRPKNVMGATKRLAELIVLGLEDVYPATAYGAVRFGNVLGSNGSVIPIFRRQIERGEPLTVTHEDVTRYFMTIPEAVQLILQASLLKELRGHIAMLDMGEPVRITDLAMNMLRLAGVPPREGQNLVFTGLRPGEKMHEELSAPTEDTTNTPIEKVRMIHSPGERPLPVLTVADRWTRLFLDGRGAEAVAELRGIFDGIRDPEAAAAGPEPQIAEDPELATADAH